MRLTRVLAIAAIAVSFADGQAWAQSRSNVQVPNELPPASYTGRQYVDSKGCVYIRAGIDGQVTWVPRVTRSRKVICGFKPTSTAATAGAQTRTATAPPPKQITVPQEVRPQSGNASGASAPTTVRRTQPAPQPKVVRRTATAPQVTVIRPAPKQAPTPKPGMQQKIPASEAKTVKVRKATSQVAQGQPACQGASAISSQYMKSTSGFTVRCGPQTQPYSTVISGGGGAGPVMRTVQSAPTPVVGQPAVRTVTRAPQAAPRPVVTSQTRVAPTHIYRKQAGSTAGISVPPGYEPVWTDDRLNPERAHQTFAGMAQTDVVWTKTVPRRLVERMTGREVTYRYPGLQYPYTSFDDQRAAGVTVVTRGVVMQEPVRVARHREGQVRRVVSAAPRQQPVATATVSTRSVPKAVAKAASHRYVQVGIFADAGQGKRAARSLAQRGLPAKTGTLNREGKAYTLVVAGPFNTQSELNSALSQSRAAGYGGARLRK